MKRIAIITPDYPPIPGGVSISLERIASNLVKREFKVLIIIPHIDEQKEYIDSLFNEYKGVEVLNILLPSSEKGFSWSLNKIGRLPQLFLFIQNYLANWKPELIHSFTLFPYSVLSGIIAQELKIPFVLSARGGDLNLNIFRPDILSYISIACNKASGIAAVTSELASRLSFISNNENICVIKNGKRSFDSLLPFPTNEKLTFGTAIAKFHPKKDIDTLIKAFNLLSKKNSNIRLLIIGPVDIEEAKTINRINRNILFVGEISNEQIYLEYNKIDVFISSSAFEGCANVLLEFMNLSKPIIASNTGGAKDFIIHKKNGLLFNPTDHNDLLNCMHKMLDTKVRDLYSQVIKNSLLSEDEEISLWIKFYLDAISQ